MEVNLNSGTTSAAEKTYKNKTVSKKSEKETVNIEENLNFAKSTNSDLNNVFSYAEKVSSDLKRQRKFQARQVENRITDLSNEVKRGKTLRPEELLFLKQHSPMTYKKAMENEVYKKDAEKKGKVVRVDVMDLELKKTTQEFMTLAFNIEYPD